MTPPKCRLCEKEHWPRAGCQFAPTPKPKSAAKKKKTKRKAKKK